MANRERTADKTLHVKIQTPTSIVWEGEAEMLSSANSAGPFDIMPDHGNMITLIENVPIALTTLSGTRKFTFEKAVVTVKENVVIVYANLASEGEADGTVPTVARTDAQ